MAIFNTVVGALQKLGFVGGIVEGIGVGIGLNPLLWPVISRNGIYTEVTRSNPRQPCENPLLGLSVTESPLPCMECTLQVLLETKKNYKDSIIASAGLTENDWRSYFDELFNGLRLLLGLIPPTSADVCGGWEGTLNTLFGKDYVWLKNVLLGALPFTNAQKLQLIDGIINRRAKEFYKKYSESYAQDLANKAYPYEKRSYQILSGWVPTCSDYLGMCCVYDEYIETRGKLLPEKKKWFKGCTENTDEAFCKSQTKRFNGEYDGYSFYPNGSNEEEKPSCRTCSNEMYHIVYCAGKLPSMASTLSLEEREEWYIDNAENISEGYYSNIVEFVGKIAPAEDEMRRRSDESTCDPLYHIVFCNNGIADIVTNLHEEEKALWYADNYIDINNGTITNISVYGKFSDAETEFNRRAGSNECAPTTTTPTEPPAPPIDIPE